MYDFLLQTILFLSLGFIVYLIARVVPRVSDADIQSRRTHGKMDEILRRLPLRELDRELHRVFEKIIRKIRVVVLRFDNTLNNYLTKLHKINQKHGDNDESGNIFHDGNGY